MDTPSLLSERMARLSLYSVRSLTLVDRTSVILPLTPQSLLIRRQDFVPSTSVSSDKNTFSSIAWYRREEATTPGSLLLWPAPFFRQLCPTPA